MKLHYVTIAIILISGMVIGWMNFINDGADSYSATVDFKGLENTQARLEKQQGVAKNLSNDMNFLLNKEGGAFETPYKLIQVGKGSADTIFGSWAVVQTMATESASGLSESGVPIPDWIVPSVIAVLIIILVAIMIYAFFKWRFED